MPLSQVNTAIKRILRDAEKTEIPSNLTPMNFKLHPVPFHDEDWIFEIKWDGFRALAHSLKGEVQLRSRNGNSFDNRFPLIIEELEKLKLNAVFDGEIVALDENECADFDKLLAGEKENIAYYVFDILWYDGYSLVNLPLLKRKELLKFILPPSERIRYCDHIQEQGEDLFEMVKEHQIEGMVAKQKNSPYVPGIRTSKWLKIKTAQVKDGIVAGLLLDMNRAGSGFSTLIIGAKEKVNYKYIGLVEAGVNKGSLHEILKRGKATDVSVFNPAPDVNKYAPFRKKIKNPQVIWLEPNIRCTVSILKWINME